MGSTTNAGRVPLDARRTQLGKGGGASDFASQRRETLSSVANDGFSDGDLNPSSGDDACLSEDELVYSDTRKYS